MNKEALRAKTYINQKVNSYKKFMCTEKMPPFELIINENELIQENFTVFASHNYSVKNDKHRLTVNKDIYEGKKEYILFHELTHMYDVVNYSAKNNQLYFNNRGYTEYHAGQVEFLKLLDANTVDEKISFSLSKSITTVIGVTTILEYVLSCRNGAKQLISQVDFPNNLNSFSTGIGMIFNHLGRVSICQLYANDYENFKGELEDLNFEKSFLGAEFEDIIKIANGLLDKENIEVFGDLFSQMVIKLYKKYENNF